MHSERNLVHDLQTLLATERDHLVQGHLEKVADLTSDKETLIRLLDDTADLDHEQLAGLRQEAARNQRLLESSLKGLRSARTRLEEIRKVATQLDTYTSGGKIQNLREAAPKLERRA